MSLALCRLLIACLSIGGAACATSVETPLDATPYDLVVVGGRVMDPETGFDAVADVGIRGSRIVAISTDITNAIPGRVTIDAQGLVVAPGFIDTHSHALDGLSIRLAARDGVTTAMDLELGAYNLDEWYTEKKGRWPLNYGTTVSHEVVRMRVHDPEVEISGAVDATTIFQLRSRTAEDGVSGWSETRSTPGQVRQITALLDEQLRAGGLGVGSTVGYARQGVTTREMYEVQRAAARYGRLTSVHSRFHGNNRTPTEAPLAFAEVYANASVLGAPLLLAHNNDYGWEEIEEKLALARSQGQVMWSEYYPYTSASTAIDAEFLRPAFFEDLMGFSYEESLFDPVRDEFLDRERYLAVAAEDPARVVIIFNPARKAWLPHWLESPGMTVASDSMWCDLSWDDEYDQYQGHPRTAGTHGKTFALARSRGVPLMTTLAQMSYLPAKYLGDAGIQAMTSRGRLQVGMVADLTIFDPARVEGAATYKRGEQGLPTKGIPYVVVGGQVVVENARFKKGVWAGQPVRFDVQDK